MKINSFTVQLTLTAVKFTLTNNIIWNLSKLKFLTKAKTCNYDQLAKYQISKFIGKYYLEFMSNIKFLTKAKNYYFDQLAKYLRNLLVKLILQFSNNKTNGKPTENQQRISIVRYHVGVCLSELARPRSVRQISIFLSYLSSWVME